MTIENQKNVAQKISAKYQKSPVSPLDELRAVDRRVNRPAAVFAYIFGSVSALVLGTGMCFAMDVIEAGTYYGITVGENMMLPGIIIGLGGMLACLLTHPLYKGILNSRRRKYAKTVLELSDRIMKQGV